MNGMIRLALSAHILFVGTLIGCAVPQAALDDATNSAKLMQEMQQQIDAMMRAQEARADRRLEQIKDERKAIARLGAINVLNAGLLDAAGLRAQAKLAATIQALQVSQAEFSVKLQADDAAIDAQTSKLLASVPATQAAVSKAEADLRPLQTQRTAEERRSFLVSYIKTVRDDVKASSALAASASASAAAAAASMPKN